MSLDRESFNRLLKWLDPDREAAGAKYEDIRFRLIKIFMRKGCIVPEELADETINRVAKRVAEIEKDYAGDKSLYFYGVARNVFREHFKPIRNPLPMPAPDPAEVIEANHICLERCLDRLDPSSRDFILQYYAEERRAKIDKRKGLAEKFGVSVGTLRMRAFRIKESLQQCVFECLDAGGVLSETQ